MQDKSSPFYNYKNSRQWLTAMVFLVGKGPRFLYHLSLKNNVSHSEHFRCNEYNMDSSASTFCMISMVSPEILPLFLYINCFANVDNICKSLLMSQSKG